MSTLLPVTHSVVSFRKWVLYNTVVVSVHYASFFLFLSTNIVEHLLCAGTLGGTKIAFELMVSIFWREETENKPTVDT